jgi:hypothetical protein
LGCLVIVIMSILVKHHRKSCLESFTSEMMSVVGPFRFHTPSSNFRFVCPALRRDLTDDGADVF